MNDNSTPSVSGGRQCDICLLCHPPQYTHTPCLLRAIFFELSPKQKTNLWWKILQPRKEVSPSNCHHCALNTNIIHNFFHTRPFFYFYPWSEGNIARSIIVQNRQQTNLTIDSLNLLIGDNGQNSKCSCFASVCHFCLLFNRLLFQFFRSCRMCQMVGTELR